MSRGQSGRRMAVAYSRVIVVAAAAASLNAAQASAQPTQAPTVATVEDAKPFLGNWTTTFDSPQGPATFDIEIHVDSGDPGATVSNAMIGASKVTDVTKSGTSLILKYVVDVQGTQVPVVISLAPDGQNLKADFSFLDGQFAASSVATRKK